MSQLVSFLEGKSPDAKGRMFDDIVSMTNVELEYDHYYIQWLFPLQTMSENAWDSPILSHEEKSTLKSSLLAQANIRRALACITSFYTTTDHWLEFDNHNHLRITRILIATRALLTHEDALVFYEMLMTRIADTHTSISPHNMVYWKEALGLILKRGTKIYLDIDGTLIHEDLSEMYGKPAEGLTEFLIALRPYDTYWLTTHCMDGDPIHAQKKLKEVLPTELYPDIERIQGTAWQDLKIEAIDWNSNFIWFDNDIYSAEWERFKAAGPDQQVIEIDLRANPNQLKDVTRDIFCESDTI